MKYAIDRYGIGLEKEVSADTFYNKYIPQKNSRFFCPECGEPVFWRSRGGSQPDKFSHYKRTEGTPECDKRVDGCSMLNLYERVGLPVYLTVRAAGQFCLNIGFPAVGEQLLAEAVLQEIKVCVAGSKYWRTVLVDTVNFLENSITLIPINFIPDSGENFTVTVEPDGKAAELQKKWSTYADGFGYGGAIFTYGEAGGKKISRGDSVSIDRQYYAIIRQFDPPQEIHFQRLGSITLNKNVYSVYLITIDVSVKNINRYKYVKNYLQKQFGVWLLQASPELIPLWPPVTDQGVLIPAKGQAKVYCSVSSGNDEPNVYRYDGCEVSSLVVDKDEGGIHTVDFSVSTQEMFLSVDRKYAGREITFQMKEIIHEKFEYDFSVEIENGKLLLWKDVTREILSETFFLNTNAKTEMYIGSSDKVFRHISVREHRVAVSAWQKAEEVLFVAEKGVIIHFLAKASDKTEGYKELLTIDQIRNCCGGEWVPVPCWVEYLLFEWKSMGFDRILEEVKRMIGNGKIPIGLLKVLFDYFCAKG